MQQASITTKYLLICVLTLTAFFMPAYIYDASANGDITTYTFGQGFSCSGGSGSGQLYTASGCSGSPADGQIFSYFVCKFETIINEALGDVYCAIVDEAKPGVMAALTMAVMFMGMMFLMGVSPFTAKELMLFAGKFSMVLAFATEAEYMIGIGYALFMTVAKEGIVIVLNYLFDGGYNTAQDVYKMFDQALIEMMGLASEDSKQEGGQCKNAIFSMMVLAAAALPPVAFIGIYFLFKLAWVMLRAVFGYCQGILGVTFLVTLAPIYVSFGLFKPTRSLFDKWVQYLISFSFQMVIVFAFLGMAFNIMKKIADDIQDYTELVKPYKQQYTKSGLGQVFDMCGVCEMNKVGPKEKPSCKSDKVMEIGQLSKDQNFLHFVSVKVFAMIIMFYILDIMMDFVPQMARYLAGPKYAGQLGGGATDGQDEVSLALPGEKNIKDALGAATQAFSKSGNTPKALVSGFLAGGGRLVEGAVKEFSQDAVGIGAALGIYSAARTSSLSGGKTVTRSGAVTSPHSVATRTAGVDPSLTSGPDKPPAGSVTDPEVAAAARDRASVVAAGAVRSSEKNMVLARVSAEVLSSVRAIRARASVDVGEIKTAAVLAVSTSGLTGEDIPMLLTDLAMDLDADDYWEVATGLSIYA